VAWRRAGRGSYKPPLHHVTNGRPVPTRLAKLVVARRARPSPHRRRVHAPQAAPHPRHRAFRSGVAIEVVARLLTRQSSTTTSQTYVPLDVEDVRDALQRAGVWGRAEPGL
jgi:hypothetical protein